MLLFFLFQAPAIHTSYPSFRFILNLQLSCPSSRSTTLTWTNTLSSSPFPPSEHSPRNWSRFTTPTRPRPSKLETSTLVDLSQMQGASADNRVKRHDYLVSYGCSSDTMRVLTLLGPACKRRRYGIRSILSRYTSGAPEVSNHRIREGIRAAHSDLQGSVGRHARQRGVRLAVYAEVRLAHASSFALPRTAQP